MDFFRSVVDTVRQAFSGGFVGGGERVQVPELYVVKWPRVDGSGEVSEISIGDPRDSIETTIETSGEVKRVRFHSVTRQMWEAESVVDTKTGKPRWRLAVWKSGEPDISPFYPNTDEWPINVKRDPKIERGDGWDM